MKISLSANSGALTFVKILMNVHCPFFFFLFFWIEFFFLFFFPAEHVKCNCISLFPLPHVMTWRSGLALCHFLSPSGSQMFLKDLILYRVFISFMFLHTDYGGYNETKFCFSSCLAHFVANTINSPWILPWGLKPIQYVLRKRGISSAPELPVEYFSTSFSFPSATQTT